MIDIFKKYIKTKGEVSDEQFELIKKHLTPKKVSKGTVLLKQGDVCRNLLFVAKGCLRSYIISAGNKVHILDFAPENRWLVDYISMFRGVSSLFCIDAVEDSEIILLGTDFYKKMPELFSDFHVTYIQHMYEKMRGVQRRLVHLLGSSGHERYLDFLNTYPELGLRLPQHMIASYLGVSPGSLSRIRNQLSQK